VKPNASSSARAYSRFRRRLHARGAPLPKARPLAPAEEACVEAILESPKAAAIVRGLEALARGEVSGAQWARVAARLDALSRPRRATRRPASRKRPDLPGMDAAREHAVVDAAASIAARPDGAAIVRGLRRLAAEGPITEKALRSLPARVRGRHPGRPRRPC
jgi:hypothetical protein